jgi:hypothetical protein
MDIIYKFNTFVTEITLHFHYKVKPINAVYKNIAFESENYTKPINILRDQNVAIWMSEQMLTL